MEENIMTNEVNEIATEAIVKTEGCGSKLVVAFGVGVITGFVINGIVINKIVKPMIKAKLIKKYTDVDAKANDVEDNQNSDEE